MSIFKKIHYGWFIVFSGMMMLACSAGMINNTFGIFLVPICNDIGCTRTEISLCQTMFAVSGLIASLLSGWIYRRFKLSATMRIGAIGACLSCALFTRMSSVPMMVALAFMMGLCSALMAWVPVSILISNWFKVRRSFALGITVTGSGIGGTLFSALGGIFLESLGWRGTLLLFSCIAAVITIPVTLFIIKPNPYDVGKRPYGDAVEEIAASQPALTGPGMKKALGMPKFYLLLLCIMMMGMPANALNGTLSSHMQDMGFSPSFSSYMFTVYMAVIIPGKIALGWAYDHLGLRISNTIGLCAMAVTAALFIFAKNQGLAILAAASAGVGLSIGSLMPAVVMRETFGTRDFGGFSGFGTAASNVGGILSLTLMGVVSDTLGSYIPAYAVIIVMALANAAALLLLTRKPVVEEE